MERIAATTGTPVYVYSAEAFRQQWRKLSHAFRVAPHRIHYSVKANSNLAVLSILRTLGAGVDIVSGGELRRAVAVGFTGPEMVFSGVGKTVAELESALANDVGLINVESEEEVNVLCSLARRLGRVVPIGVRVNPDVTTQTHPYTQTGQQGMKFGVPMDRAASIAKRVADESCLDLRCVGMHIGSQVVDVKSYREGVDKLVKLIRDLRATDVDSLEAVDIGGGFAISYDGKPEMDLEALTSVMRDLHDQTGLTILLEPGRFLAGNSGVLLTRVLYTKRAGGRRFVIVDAGMNDFIRPSYYQAFHGLHVVACGHASDVGPHEPADIVGPICETGDFQARDRLLPAVGHGALLAILGAGAYGFSMSSTYNSRPRPAEVLVDDYRFAIVRSREEVTDLWKGETGEPIWQ